MCDDMIVTSLLTLTLDPKIEKINQTEKERKKKIK